jgi:hypothetical protein
MRKAIVLAVSLVGIVMLIAGTAGAHSAKTYKSKVVLSNGGPTGASGMVTCTTSRCPATCVSKRKVTLFRIQNGVSAPVGSAQTNTRGSFRVNSPLIAGNYDATVAPKRVSKKIFCATATSIRYHF